MFGHFCPKNANFSMFEVLFRDATFCKLTPGTSTLWKLKATLVDVYEIRVCRDYHGNKPQKPSIITHCLPQGKK